MTDIEIQQIGGLLTQLTAQNPASAKNVADRVIEYLTQTIHETSAVPASQAYEQAQFHAKVKCIACLGKGELQTGLNLVAVLDRRQKPKHITPTAPRIAPKHCRWVCWLCDGVHHIFTKSADLRNHLNKGHGFPEEQIKEVFNTRNGKKLYEHFGPCTGADAAKNGWNIRSITLSRKRRASDVNTSAVAAYGTKSQGKKSYASVAKANDTSSLNPATSSSKARSAASPAPPKNVLKSPTVNIQGLWPTPAETRIPKNQPTQQSNLDPSQSGVGNQFGDEPFVPQSAYPAAVFGDTIDNTIPPEFALLQHNHNSATQFGLTVQTTLAQHRLLAPWNLSLSVNPADLNLNTTPSPFASEILTWPEGSVAQETYSGLDEQLDGMDFDT